MRKTLWITGLGLVLVAAGAAFFHRPLEPAAPTIPPALAQPVPFVQETPAPPVLEDAPHLPAVSVQKLSLPPLRLEGTVLDDNPLAFIRSLETGQADFYRKGDLIQTATVTNIQRGEVTLSLNGQTHRLYLEDAPTSHLVEETGPLTRLIHKEGVLELLAQEGENDLKGPLRLKSQSDPEGRFLGYEIEGISFGTLPYWAGLRNGDRVREVNHQALSTPQKAIQTFKKVRRLEQVELDILRNQKSIHLSYEIR